MSAPASDTHRLIHYPETQGLSDTTSGRAMVLLESCSDKLPFGWLFLFGSRNIWEPGETVEARGGAAADRDPTATPIDIALVRLHEAAGVLRNDPVLGPLFAGLDLLERVLESAGERGQLRLQSPPGAFGEGKEHAEKRSRVLERVAVAENIVFHMGHKGGREQVAHALNSLRSLCAFVPKGELASDWKAMQKAAKKLGDRCPVEQSPVRLLVGWPPGSHMTALFAAEAPRIARELGEKAATPPSGPAIARKSAAKPWWAFWKK